MFSSMPCNDDGSDTCAELDRVRVEVAADATNVTLRSTIKTVSQAVIL